MHVTKINETMHQWHYENQWKDNETIDEKNRR